MTFDTASSAAPLPTTPEYPIRLEVNRPAQQSRLTNFPFAIGLLIRSILLIPHLVALFFIAIAAAIVQFIATIVILFTGRYPAGLFNFYVGYTRWTANVFGYLFHLYDEYPPFSLDDEVDYPLHFTVDYPERLNRILNFPYIGYTYIKPILCIPHLVILIFLIIAAMVVVLIAPFAILINGSFPEGMHRFVVGVGRWSLRVQGYIAALTDKYPPFSLD
jgi:hypothetical protein